MRSKSIILAATLLAASAGWTGMSAQQGQDLPDRVKMGQERVKVRQEIRLPQVAGYDLLKCDLHIHTIFSDGIVWPSLRVREAWEEGLDAIALTEHVEGQPAREGVQKGDLDLSYKNAEEEADRRDIVLIKGAEITRSMPPGHLNALFLQDVDALQQDDVIDALKEAKKQGAFIFWNHPGWNVKEVKWHDLHEQLWQEGLLNGIEVFNEFEWYPKALEWAKEKNLTLVANTDVHDVIERLYDKRYASHRPLTLVMAKEKSVAAIKEALFAGRTLIWFYDTLVGKADYLKEFFQAAVQVESPHYVTDAYAYLTVKNTCDVPFTLQAKDAPQGYPASIVLPAGASVVVSVPKDGAGNVTYTATNLLTAYGQGVEVTLF